MAKRVDDFSESTKRKMADRVAWRCSFSGCNKITIGPNSSNSEKIIKLGQAAHITAASIEGPRYDNSITSAQRKDISNGIWMCCDHATLIDADFREYSEETLRLWKIDAERVAAENLKAPNNEYLDNTSTLLQIGSEIIFYARWEGTTANTRTFRLVSPLIGDINKIEAYVEGFNRCVNTEHYVVIESQGDARVISSPPELNKKNNEILLTLTLTPPPESIDPKGISSLTLRDGDLFLDLNGNISMVSGVEAAIQSLSTCLGTIKGECNILHCPMPELGSVVSFYYKQYKDDLKLLSRLFKLELIRLSFVQIHENTYTNLPFIKRIHNVNIQNIELINQYLDIEISIVFGNNEHWKGNVPVFIAE